MWCRDCQQDVPAVAKSVEGPLVCTRCEAEFELSDQTSGASSRPDDQGVALEGFDSPGAVLMSPMSWESDETEQRLRRIGQQLRTAYRHDSTPKSSGVPTQTWGSENLARLAQEPRIPALHEPSGKERAHYTATSRIVSLLLFLGLIGFVVGVFSLVWSAAFGLPKSWQWGMTATIAGEGSLIVGLTWMALRLWHNSRRLNRQIDGVDRQLHELEYLTGSAAAGSLSASQHFYSHYNQGASSHMLLANLQGQVEQLSTRLAG